MEDGLSSDTTIRSTISKFGKHWISFGCLIDMDKSFKDAAQEGSIDVLYSLIRSDPYILDKIDVIPFVETPLHIAASMGHTGFVSEIVKLKPSFLLKLNEDGYSPMHLALQNNQTQVVLVLIDADTKSIRIQGREGMTPLHFVAKEGNLDLLTRFLKVCPESIIDLTIWSESALHIALKHYRFEALQLMLGWLRRTWFKDASSWEKKLLNLKDKEGNSILHIATSKNLVEVVRWLLDSRIDDKVKNLKGLTAFEISLRETRINNEEIKNMLRPAKPPFWTPYFSTTEDLAKFFRSPTSEYQLSYIQMPRAITQITDGTRSALLVVAALLITITFHVTLNPPRGIWGDDYTCPANNTSCAVKPSHRAGTPIMDPISAGFFYLINWLSFLFTILTILLLLPSAALSSLCLAPLFFLLVAFIVTDSVTYLGGKGPSGVIGLSGLYITPIAIMLVPYLWVQRKLVAAFRP